MKLRIDGVDYTVGEEWPIRQLYCFVRQEVKPDGPVVLVVDGGYGDTDELAEDANETLESIGLKSGDTLRCILQNAEDPYLILRLPPTGQGYSPLHAAARGNSVDAILQLISMGSDIEAKSEDGHTPYQYAVAAGSVEAQEILLKHGAKDEPCSVM
eukprot:TRINITY_DN44320_c0_g1_i1.p1 TRINITY_DN44320_c0_g1~~TRINITY_DN44320_c0_g1_i1.p1  ORF type:complete len:156 (+),score=3.12 TRINITY_DN44320_c0_g1_i1:81-548(+)